MRRSWEENGGGEVFLGRDWMSRWSYGEKKAAEIDHEVSRIAHADALRCLREHRSYLDRTAESRARDARRLGPGGAGGRARGASLPSALYAVCAYGIPRRSAKVSPASSVER